MESAGLEFTCIVSRSLAKVVRSLAESDKEGLEAPKLIDFATTLFNIAEELDRPQPRHRAIPTKRIAQYLADLERTCTALLRSPSTKWPRKTVCSSVAKGVITADQFPRLQSIVKGKTGTKDLALCLKSLVRSPHSRLALFKKLDSFLPRQQKPTDRIPNHEGTDELPDRIFGALYDALVLCIECYCPSSAALHRSERLHISNLKLSWKQQKQGNDAVFDTVFQASAAHQNESKDRWQCLRFRLPKELNTAIHRNQASNVGLGHIDEPQPPTSPMHPTDFCGLLIRPRGAISRQIRVVNGALYDLKEPVQAEQKLAAQKNVIRLSEALKLMSLSDEGKLFLAHSIALSVWHFYGTKLMRYRWTVDEICFLAEEPQRAQTLGIANLNPLHPFVSMRFECPWHFTKKVEDEFVPDEELVHWAPRIFALGTVLTTIFNETHLPDPSHDSLWQETYNNQAFDCGHIVADPSWPSLEMKSPLVRKTIKDAVAACLDGEIFNNRTATLAERKALLYKRVVWPLEYVLKIAGIDAQKAVWTNKIAEDETSGIWRRQYLPQNGSSSSRTWIDRLVSSQLNRDIFAFHKANRDARRTRIAILDTGYDADHTFFAKRGNRLPHRHWKDFVDASSKPLDDDGHGTHVLSIAMKVAPSADMYIARVAKKSSNFSKSYSDFVESNNRIAKAIDWAVNEMEVDIISMSFGWSEEHESKEISRAIWRALESRKDRILFFAAASNSGGDYGQWFPASHEGVIAVRATTHAGEFLGFNAPPDYAGPDVIGTLGLDVPGASCDPEMPEREDTGTSFATPIAAAISALTLDAAKLNHNINGEVLPHRNLAKLQTRKGMREMFRANSMSRKMGDRTWYLSAVEFCNQSQSDRKTVLDNAALHAR